MASRQEIIEATYLCVARSGLSKTTVEDAAREAGVSRATVYRLFPGGREELLDATVAWATLDFFLRLYEEVRDAATLEEVMERGIAFAHRAILEHQVLQRVLQTEPEKLLPALTVESNRIRSGIAAFLVPFLEERGIAEGVDPGEASDFLAADGPFLHGSTRTMGPRGPRSSGSAGAVRVARRRGVEPRGAVGRISPGSLTVRQNSDVLFQACPHRGERW